MARDVFFDRTIQTDGGPLQIQAAISFNEQAFGTLGEGVTPWTISIHNGERDLGRIVGFEGLGSVINSMHSLKPDAAAARGCELTVYRMGDVLIQAHLDAAILAAFERWLLKRGWRGNIVKRMKFYSEEMVVPVRQFWIKNGYELIPGEEGKWDEHVVKRWR
jgi:hypothetical protein